MISERDYSRANRGVKERWRVVCLRDGRFSPRFPNARREGGKYIKGKILGGKKGWMCASAKWKKRIDKYKNVLM